MNSLWQKIEDRSIPVPFAGCLIWLGPVRRNNYGAIYDPSKKKTVIAHRAAYEIHKGPIPEGIFICHSCDTPSCVNPDHLFLGTTQDNTADMMKKNRSCKGHFPYNTVLSKEIVLAIFLDVRSRREICQAYNASPATVSQIKSGSQWSCVTGKIYSTKVKTQCNNGHPWITENIGISKGSKYCKICNRIRRLENYYRSK